MKNVKQLRASPSLSPIPASTVVKGAIDLVPVRTASQETGVDVNTIRKWISHGKHGRKLPTYRKPGETEVMLVSLDLVRRWRDRKTREVPEGPAATISLHLESECSKHLRELADLMSKRLGWRVSLPQAVASAVEHATRLEHLRQRTFESAAVDTKGQPE